MPTIDQINAMTPDERAALSKKLTRQLANQFAKKVVVSVLTVVAVHVIVDQIEKRIPAANEN